MSRKKKLLLIYGTLVLMLLGTAGWYVLQTLDAPAPRPVTKPAKKEKTPPGANAADKPLPVSDKPSLPDKSAEATQPDRQASKTLPIESPGKGASSATQPESVRDVSSSPPSAIAETGKVDGLSALHVQIEEYKLLVQIEELKAKLSDLKKVQTVAAASAPPVLSLPALTPPQSTEPPAVPLQPRRAKGPAVMSVHGVDENLVAEVRLEGGKRITLRKGEKFGGGVVSEVSRSAGVVIRIGKKTTVLPFE